jgi:HPt (histidine-containing phosphotransfer) domain-containing protein
MTLTALALTDLRESFENDSDILNSILDMFLEEVPQDYLILKSSIQNEDFKAAGLQAHKVKSSYRTLGIDNMASILQDIENCAKTESDLSSIPVLLSKFNEKYEHVNAQVLYTKEQL